MNVDPVARRDGVNSRADLHDLAGDVVAGDQRELRLVGVADVRPHPAIQAVDGHGADTHHGLAGPGGRVGHVLDGQGVEAAV